MGLVITILFLWLFTRFIARLFGPGKAAGLMIMIVIDAWLLGGAFATGSILLYLLSFTLMWFLANSWRLAFAGALARYTKNKEKDSL